MYTKIKTEEEIQKMRISGKMLANVLKVISNAVEPGISELDISELAKKELRSLGGKPAFLGYMGFPDVICISVNEEVVHGIPKNRELNDGDIVGLDFGVNYEGMITDSAKTIIVGKQEDKIKEKLILGTNEALFSGIDVLHHGVRVGDISAAIEQKLKSYGFGIVRNLVGHGVGHNVHEEPNIPNYGIKGTGDVLKAGMTIAIEPMTTLGKEDVLVKEDGWTVVTKDGSLSAHFEHTVLITNNGFEILTEE
ncbi:type I methionyl aminopeptidase [Candidatus Saccharibacteria bacterium CPR2]|nr:type I methionyl aminopeptidase [Candidatus Saccharibacteria bacterium CPR2]